MISRQIIKERAREQLGRGLFTEKWLMGLLACLVVSLLTSAAGTVIPAAGLLLAGPMAYGLSYVFLNSARTRETVKVGDIFAGFTDDFGQTFLLGLLIGLFTFLWSLLFIIPGIVKSYAYSMSYYIKADNPQLEWRECIELSKSMTEGHKWELFVLDLSFIGWYILGAMCLGVGTLWVAPYHSAAKTQFYLELKGGERSYELR